ncbi:MAG: hypothetical protein K9J85_12085 [Desulfobacteraceae bacterium]|nr:hypothetical protein [Desulfobacteraceae bacterium]
MKTNKNRTGRFRRFLSNERKSSRNEGKWPDWKKDPRVAKYVSLLK